MLTVREAAALPHTPEIRRYSHVGRLYLRDGDVPVRMLNDRESASVPEHIRNDSRFIYPIGFPWSPVRYQLACGFPICYVDDSVSGKVLNRCTNGKIYECQRDGNDRCHYEFLREATSEDDVRAGIEREADHRRAGERMRKILELGLRVRYADYPEPDKGTVYERHPDRKLYRIDFDYPRTNDEVMTFSRSFLRYATPEDDALYDFESS